MKKKIIVLSILIFIISAIAITFALPSFRINKIDLLKDSKINEIKSVLDSKYEIKEPLITASGSEEEILRMTYEVASILIGKPNVQNSDDYFTATTKFDKFLSYCYDNSNLPLDDNGEVKSNYKFYILDENNTKEDSFYYEFKTLMNLKVTFYEELKIKDFYTYDGINYNVLLRASNAKFMVTNQLTGSYENVVGDVDIRFNIISNNGIKILYFYINYDNEKGEKVSGKDQSEVNSLVGKLSYNEVEEREYTEAEKANIEGIYAKYKDSVVSLSTTNVNNAITSNATGFFIRKGVILTSWKWFEEYLLSNDNLIVSDINNRIYQVDGIISFSTVYDIVAIKLTEEVGNPITETGYVSSYNKDLVVALTSPTSIGIATNVGEVMGSEHDIIKLKLTLTKGEVGSPLFNIKGELVGITNNNQLNSTISFASDKYAFSTMNIRLKYADFEDIKVYKLASLKNNMYSNTISKIVVSKEYDQELYDKYMVDFDIKKAYGDSISSIVTSGNKMTIKVDFAENNIISKKQYVNLYASKLKSAGYNLTTNDYQLVLEKENIRINIKYESSYIVITYRGI